MKKKWIKKRHQKVGCLISVLDKKADKFAIGWSLCKACDRESKFNQKLAENIAHGRAMNILNVPHNYDIPHSILAEYTEMIDRCKRYYKGCEFISINVHKRVQPQKKPPHSAFYLMFKDKLRYPFIFSV